MQIKKLLWWHYQPADEREQQLFYQAYRRSWLAFQLLIVVYFLFITQPSEIMTTGKIILAILTMGVVSTLISATIFLGEPVTFKRNLYTKLISMALLLVSIVIVLGGILFVWGTIFDCGVFCS